jgi:hypothetical protein
MPTALNATGLPQVYDILITRGDSFEAVFSVTDNDGVAVSLTGLQGEAEVRSQSGGTVLATLTVDVDQSLAGQATTGYVTVSATGADMDAAINGVWDLEIHDGSPTFAFRKTIVTGAFATVSQVTDV